MGWTDCGPSTLSFKGNILIDTLLTIAQILIVLIVGIVTVLTPILWRTHSGIREQLMQHEQDLALLNQRMTDADSECGQCAVNVKERFDKVDLNLLELNKSTALIPGVEKQLTEVRGLVVKILEKR